MTKKLKTYVAFVLDRSGSMHTISEEAVEGYNAHIRKFKENTDEQEVIVSLVTFNSNVYEHYWLENVKDQEEANQKDYNPGGTTALLDAMGYTIDKLQESTDINDENNAYVVITISDGQENASKHVSDGNLKNKISALQKTGRWTFTFMGCDAVYMKEVARATAIPVANMAVWSNASKEGTKFAYAKSADSADKYMKRRLRASSVRGMSAATFNFYSDSDSLADFSSDDGSMDTSVSTPAPADVMSPLWAGSVSCASPASFGTSKLEVKAENTGTANIFSAGKHVDWKS